MQTTFCSVPVSLGIMAMNLDGVYTYTLMIIDMRNINDTNTRRDLDLVSSDKRVASGSSAMVNPLTNAKGCQAASQGCQLTRAC